MTDKKLCELGSLQLSVPKKKSLSMCHPVSRVVFLPRVKYWEDHTVTIYIPSQQEEHSEGSNWPELYTEIEEVETKEQECVQG